ncbi:kinase-like protein, partial [Panus rudis PR-1116 ss-1]
MVAFTSPSAASSPSPPPVGTFIHNGSLQLVEILGYGGYGIVYRAIPTNYPASSSTPPPSYAVKCLPAKRHSSSSLSRNRARDPHQHETYLHKLACSPPHPNIITLHDSVVDPYTQHTYIIMDFAPGGDLFTQILHKRAFLGYGDRIRNVFLQLIDAVERCHERGVYHRDLKPENILCWEVDETLHPRRKHSMRVALTDFGLATRDIWSKEFRTGSVYHMSPECHGPSTPTSHGATGYSPAHSDLFSLGIILLNLITGRNPWKSASPTDPTFQAYCRDPHHFLMSVLPISQEVNEVLV